MKRGGFWKRQFQDLPTVGQYLFDLIFGVLMPAICLVKDPIVFLGEGVLSRYQIFCYVIIGMEAAILLLWLHAGRWLKPLAGILSGILLAGMTVAFAIGLAILPYSLIGLFFIVGVMGFVPFLTAFVFMRNGVRAWHFGRRTDGVWLNRGAAVLGMVLVLAPPAYAHLELVGQLDRDVEAVVEGNALRYESAVNRLKLFRWIVDLDPIVWEYQGEESDERKAYLARAYKDITGEEIERLDWYVD